MDNLRILLWNANGLLSRKLELEAILNHEKIDIALVTETHCTAQYSFNSTSTFNVLHAFHPTGKAQGGAAVFVNKKLAYSPDLTASTTQFQLCAIRLPLADQHLTVASVYCSPSCKTDSTAFDLLFQNLKGKWLAGGDYNAKHSMWGSRIITTRGRELAKVIERRNYEAISSGQPTYWPSDCRKTPDVIDFFVVNHIHRHQCHVSTIADLSSDHIPVLLTLAARVHPRTSPISLVNRYTDWDLFRSHIDGATGHHLPISDTASLERAVHNFTFAMQEAARLSTPSLPLPIYPLSALFTNLCRQRRHARKHWQQTRSPQALLELRRLNCQVRNALRKTRNDALQTHLSSLSPRKESDYSLWKGTRKFRRAPIPPLPPLLVDNQWVRNDAEKVEHYAAHLQSVFSPHQIPSPPLPVPESQPHHRFSFSPKAVARIIDRLNVKKAPGFDRITARMLRELPRTGILWLTRIYNAILRFSTFPATWKCAKVIMLPKPGKNTADLSSYRPISLLSILSKTFEKLLHNKLQSLLPQSALPNHQFGFRMRHSTTDQLRRVTSTILTDLEEKRYCAAAFLDVSQAFDRVWHAGLHFKLSRLLPANVCALLRNYLTERSFFVVYNDHVSSTRPITAGVPQGSVLGPLLYTLYTADLPEPPETTLATFADDTAFLASAADYPTAVESLQSALTDFLQWTNRWKIRLNSAKLVNITFTNRSHAYIPVTLGTEVIPYQTSVKYLGLHLEERLTYATHIRKKRQELDLRFRQLQWLFRPRSGLSLENRRVLYLALLRPIWAYALPIWGCASASQRAIIQRFQSKALRRLAGAPWFVRNDVLHRDLQIPWVEDCIRHLATCHEARLHGSANELALLTLDNSQATRRLCRRHCADLVT